MVSVYYPGDTGLCSPPHSIPNAGTPRKPFSLSAGILQEISKWISLLSSIHQWCPVSCKALEIRGQTVKMQLSLWGAQKLEKDKYQLQKGAKAKNKKCPGRSPALIWDRLICGNRGRLLRRELEDPPGWCCDRGGMALDRQNRLQGTRHRQGACQHWPSGGIGL